LTPFVIVGVAVAMVVPPDFRANKGRRGTPAILRAAGNKTDTPYRPYERACHGQ
jgi:hypothetical protein